MCNMLVGVIGRGDACIAFIFMVTSYLCRDRMANLLNQVDCRSTLILKL